jgi:hypothetical protein
MLVEWTSPIEVKEVTGKYWYFRERAIQTPKNSPSTFFLPTKKNSLTANCQLTSRVSSWFAKKNCWQVAWQFFSIRRYWRSKWRYWRSKWRCWRSIWHCWRFVCGHETTIQRDSHFLRASFFLLDSIPPCAQVFFRTRTGLQANFFGWIARSLNPNKAPA